MVRPRMDDSTHPEREGAAPNDGPFGGLPGPSAEIDRGAESCPACDGSGQHGRSVCPRCDGLGRVS